ncbi:MAG TPA: SAM-dependent chlorinase/fluorinase [Chitinophagales bacterium]|nr:SAM-dependent chlorinase/fluorinase [Chitinophagales bacterium]
MPIVTLTTDFGHADIYAGRFKGKLLSVQSDLNIVDVTHNIPAYNIVTGAFNLRHTYTSFPKGTIHIIRVNEQGLIKDGLLIAYYKGYYFLAPNNKVLPLALNNQFDWIRSVNFDQIQSQLADGIYAEVLKYVLENRYEEISYLSEYESSSEWAVNTFDSHIRGMVVIVDYYGNLITNIHMKDLTQYMDRFSEVVIQYRDKDSINGIVGNYNDVVKGDQMCRINDLGFLEIAINEGAAYKLLGIKFGQIVNVFFS